MKRTQFITAEEVAAAMGVSRSKASQIVRTLNRELRAMGFITIAGKCPVQYFEKRCYGMQVEEGDTGTRRERNGEYDEKQCESM